MSLLAGLKFVKKAPSAAAATAVSRAEGGGVVGQGDGAGEEGKRGEGKEGKRGEKKHKDKKDKGGSRGRKDKKSVREGLECSLPSRLLHKVLPEGNSRVYRAVRARALGPLRMRTLHAFVDYNAPLRVQYREGVTIESGTMHKASSIFLSISYTTSAALALILVETMHKANSIFLSISYTTSTVLAFIFCGN